jgi:hypothetical protein
LVCLYRFEYRPAITANVLALGAVADYGTQNYQYTTKVDARWYAQLTTSPAIETKAYYREFFLSFYFGF